MKAVQNQFNLHVKLMEECAEVIHASSKTLKRGLHGVEKYNLSEECGDVLACIEMLEARGLLDIHSVYRKKHLTISKYDSIFNEQGTQ